VEKVPVIERVKEFIMASVIPGGTLNNLDFVSGCVDWPEEISRTQQIILCDAQTSGGLLISVPAAAGPGLQQALHSNDVTDAAIIGRIVSAGEGKIVVRKD
jgi:selenide,water dikinase